MTRRTFRNFPSVFTLEKLVHRLHITLEAGHIQNRPDDITNHFVEGAVDSEFQPVQRIALMDDAYGFDSADRVSFERGSSDGVGECREIMRALEFLDGASHARFAKAELLGPPFAVTVQP